MTTAVRPELVFTTTTKKTEPDAKLTLDFELDGYTYTTTKPKDALIAQLSPISSRRTPALTKIALSLNFLEDCLVEPGRSHLRARLLDEKDSLDAEDVMPILAAIGDHWKAVAKAK